MAWDNHVARRVGNVVKTSEDGEILEKAEIFDYAQVQRMIAMRKAREAAKSRYEKELRKKRGVILEESEDKDEDAKTEKKKKKKKKQKKQKAKPGEPESLEAIAKRLAEQEFRDDDDAFFGESTTSSDDENEDSDTESDVDEKELKREKERHDRLLRLHVKNLHKAEKKTVKESVKTKVLRLFRRGPPGQ